jgi:hypothetical protein
MVNFKIIDNNVYAVEEIATTSQVAIVESFHDTLYHIKVTSNKYSIAADGIDKAIVTATLYDYLDVQQDADTRIIQFDVDGTLVEFEAIAGMANIEVVSLKPGTINIKTVNANIRNGGVVIECK